MTTSATSSAASNAASSNNVFTNLNKAQAASNTAQQLQSQFLQLLTTQLQNQDPTSPADSSQMTTQLAQISTVSGIQDLNSSINGMAATFNAAQSFQAAGLIGHQVLANGDALIYDPTSQSAALTKPQVQVTIPDNAGKVTVSIYDSKNNPVDTIPLGNAAAGTQMVTWNGKDLNGNAVPSGTYTVVAKGTDSSGNPINLSTATYVGVTSVSLTSSGISLDTTGGQSIAMTDISQIQ